MDTNEVNGHCACKCMRLRDREREERYDTRDVKPSSEGPTLVDESGLLMIAQAGTNCMHETDASLGYVDDDDGDDETDLRAKTCNLSTVVQKRYGLQSATIQKR
ncbi:hypothetical protein GOP47_0019147 [Adiantum capillus-veneris]|uniref:Uncharacterized protein n=1 Tax=Adiantum capillus-veneris TaxID=13818 RepID=A0A9D4UEJ1_ADICA|nr:hypothetical protein GOP47_0019147 [Adiantum capillus-veneris]